MATACTETKYFSGQGAILIGERDGTTGKPTGLRPVGNVSAVSLGIETTTFEHKESCSGVRGVDLEITQEVNVSLNMTLESLAKENLSLALFGTNTAVVGASASDEIVKGYHDLWTPLPHVKISNLVVGDDAVPTTTYVEGTDYEVNLETGSIMALSTGSITDTQDLYCDYDYAAQSQVEAATSGTPPIRFVRFEGLNTADGDKPVVIDIYKVSMQPLAELAVIQDEIAQMEVEAKALSDALQTSGSKYFTIRYVE